jgi:ribosomal protein S7
MIFNLVNRNKKKNKYLILQKKIQYEKDKYKKNFLYNSILKIYKPYTLKSLLNKFSTLLMKKGKKKKAEIIVLKLIILLKKKYKNKNIFYLLKKILFKIKPVLDVRFWVKSGKKYQIPTLIRKDKSLILALRWLIKCSYKRKEKSIIKKLYNECLEILKNKGSTLKKKKELYILSLNNRPYLKFLNTYKKFYKHYWFMKNYIYNTKKIVNATSDLKFNPNIKLRNHIKIKIKYFKIKKRFFRKLKKKIKS